MEKHLNSTTATEGKSYTIGNQYYQTGWICPRCGAVMSPSMLWCVNCINGNKVEVVTNIPNTNSEPHLPNTIVWNGPTPNVNLK